MFRIKPIRNKLGITQKELADKVQIAQSYLSEIETGKANPSFQIIQRIALKLGVSMIDLLKENDNS